jgi:hypothetical protein
MSLLFSPTNRYSLVWSGTTTPLYWRGKQYLPTQCESRTVMFIPAFCHKRTDHPSKIDLVHQLQSCSFRCSRFLLLVIMRWLSLRCICYSLHCVLLSWYCPLYCFLYLLLCASLYLCIYSIRSELVIQMTSGTDNNLVSKKRVGLHLSAVTCCTDIDIYTQRGIPWHSRFTMEEHKSKATFKAQRGTKNPSFTTVAHRRNQVRRRKR